MSLGRCHLRFRGRPNEIRQLVQSYVVFLNSVHEAQSRCHREALLEYEPCSEGRRELQQAASSLRALQSILPAELCFVQFEAQVQQHVVQGHETCHAMSSPFWSAVLESVLSSGVMPSGVMPSTATLCRARLFLDVSYTLLMQSWFESQVKAGSVFYILADSSPQEQQNWFEVKGGMPDSSPQEQQNWFEVKGGMLVRCSKIIELCVLCSQDSPVCAQELEASLDWLQELKDASFHHVFPNSALGVKHATLAHKVHALCHSLRLETSWRHTQNLLDSTVAFTSDQGVETSLNQVVLSLAQAFPHWHSSTVFEADCGLGLEA